MPGDDLPALRTTGEPRTDSAARKHRARRHEPALTLPGRRGTGSRDALRQDVAAQPRSDALAGHRALGRRPLARGVRRHGHARRPRGPGARAAARVARRVRSALVRVCGALRVHAAVRGSAGRRVEHHLDVAVRAAAPAPALARARARGHRQHVADDAAGVHAGHRRSRPGRAGRLTAQPAHPRDGLHGGLHRRLARDPALPALFRGGPHRHRRARLPHAAPARVAALVFRQPPHRRHPAQARWHPAGPRLSGPVPESPESRRSCSSRPLSC